MERENNEYTWYKYSIVGVDKEGGREGNGHKAST
jgi:hypothetical protein